MSTTSTSRATEPARRRGLSTPVVVALQALAVVVLLAAAGAVAGYTWFRLWDAPTGVVQSGRWFTDETGLRADFSGTALYVVVGAVAGLICGIIAGLLLARWEVLTLVVLLLASGLAGWLMWHTGTDRGPADPQVLARGAPDGTRLPGELHVSGRTPFVAFPLGALLGYAVLLISVPKRGARGAHGDRHDHGHDSDGPPRSTFPPGPAG